MLVFGNSDDWVARKLPFATGSCGSGAEVQVNPSAGGPEAEVQSKEICALDRPFREPVRGFIANVERIREYGAQGEPAVPHLR